MLSLYAFVKRRRLPLAATSGSGFFAMEMGFVIDHHVPALFSKLGVAGGLRLVGTEGLFNDDLVANAAMDRLLHHVHVIEDTGASYRNPPSLPKKKAS